MGLIARFLSHEPVCRIEGYESNSPISVTSAPKSDK